MARILLVDDDEGMRCILSEYLGAIGHDCALASNVIEAKRQLEGFKFDLVLSDINMPGESGMDLLQHASSHYPDMPIMLMTADESPRIKKESFSMGASAFISKPFRLAELLDKINGALESRSHRVQTRFETLPQVASRRMIALEELNPHR